MPITLWYRCIGVDYDVVVTYYMLDAILKLCIYSFRIPIVLVRRLSYLGRAMNRFIFFSVVEGMGVGLSPSSTHIITLWQEK